MIHHNCLKEIIIEDLILTIVLKTFPILQKSFFESYNAKQPDIACKLHFPVFSNLSIYILFHR